MFQTIYPEHKWDIYKFLQVPQGYKKKLLEDSSTQKEFVHYLEKKFNITKTSDWYSITHQHLKQILKINISTAMGIVKNFYPELNIKNFQSTKSTLFALKSALYKLFPNQEIVEDYRLVNLDNLELDYYLPNLKLAFKCQVIFL